LKQIDILNEFTDPSINTFSHLSTDGSSLFGSDGTLTIVIGLNNKGIIYSIDYLVVAAGFVFLFIDKYS